MIKDDQDNEKKPVLHNFIVIKIMVCKILTRVHINDSFATNLDYEIIAAGFLS